jgi:phage repressor protein C with HTH and peptisase S24 domain
MSTTVVDEEFRRRLRLIMQQFGSVADLARAVGVSDNAIYKWVSGRGQPSMMSLVNLAKAAGVSVEWLATGRGASGRIRGEAASSAESSEHADHVGRAVTTPPPSPQIVEYVRLRGDWLQRVLGADARAIAMVEAVGDSMAPTIDEGDVALTDLRENRFRYDGVYVIRSDNELAIKRIQRQPDGALLVRGDNPAYEPATVRPDQLKLLGRVMWVFGRL